MFFLFAAVLTLLSQVVIDKMHLRATDARLNGTTEEANVAYQQYVKTLFSLYSLNALIWLFINFFMMVMIYNHSRSMNNEEKVIEVRNEMIIMVNRLSNESVLVRDSAHLSMLRSTESPN